MSAAPTRAFAPDPRGLAQLPPETRLFLLLNGKPLAQTVFALAALGIPDHLAQGPRTAAELAGATGTRPDALRRLLRFAASAALLDEEADGTFAGTPLSELLCAGHPAGLRDLAVLNGSEELVTPYAHILHTLRTGEPAFEKVYGKPLFAHLAEDPTAGATFDRAMTGLNQALTDIYLAGCDFSRFAALADIGGGRGTFLAAVLRAHPRTRGLLFDRPDVIDRAEPDLPSLGTGGRLSCARGDFFDAVPPGHDAYLLKSVLHDWDDAHARTILRTVRAAMADNPRARLIVMDDILPPPNHWDAAAMLDLDMLLLTRGRERTLEEWNALLDSGGYHTVATSVTEGRVLFECAPR